MGPSHPTPPSTSGASADAPSAASVSTPATPASHGKATAVAQQLEFPKTYEGIYLDRSARVADLLDLDTALEPGDITTVAGYTGTYGYTTEAAIAAIHLVASTEGIMLDPNYTGKSMSGLIDQIQSGNVDPEVPVVFIHTGGLPQTFAFADELWNWQPT